MLAVILSVSLGYATTFTAVTGAILGVTSLPLFVYGLLVESISLLSGNPVV